MVFISTLLFISTMQGASGDSIAHTESLFAHPGSEYTSGPLWVWNDLLTTEQIEHTLNFLADQHIRQVWVHPRPGLMTPYLSDDWFARYEDTLRVAEERDILVWIYDENSYPSGFAGGYVPEQMPESRSLGMRLEEVSEVDLANPAYYAIYEKTDTGLKLLPAGEGIRTGAFLVGRIEEAGTSPWYGGKFFVDLLRPGVTEKFLEITLDAYKERFGKYFGNRIPGSFTDEPHLRTAGEFHWTPDLPEQYALRWNRDFRDDLPLMKEVSAEGRRVRHHYFRTINELFMERWGRKYHDYCAANDLEMTGHYWEHEWPNCAMVPDNMAMSSLQQRPGIDMLLNRYEEGPHAQFGNVRSCLEVSSVASQTGRARTLCEVYGASGAEMTFEDYKRIGDWLQVLGVNTLNEHLSDITQRGARKRDYPPSFSYHSPWMEQYHVLVDYFARITSALTQGEQINRCLLLEPTTTAWMYQFSEGEHLAMVGDDFQALVVRLAKEQLEFDLGTEAILPELGSVHKTHKGCFLRVGERNYSVVIIPAEMENLDRCTFELLKEFLDKGGLVLSVGNDEAPRCVDGVEASEVTLLKKSTGWKRCAPEQVTATAEAHSKPGLKISLADGNTATVYHHRRQLKDGEILFLVNTSNDCSAAGSISTPLQGIRKACPRTGKIEAYPSKRDGKLCTASFVLPPCGSLLLFLDQKVKAADPAPAQAAATTQIALSDIEVRRVDDNNMILDYVDVQVREKSLQGVFWKEAAAFSFKENGLSGNIWDHCVQFRDELLQMEFPEDSGFQMNYRFTIEGAVPERLYLVVERADLYTITCNDVAIRPEEGLWWLDRSFQMINLAGAAQSGDNRVHLSAQPMTVFHELEAAHLVGDFSVKPTEKGFVVTAAAPLKLGAWNAQGLPFYGRRVCYTATAQIEQKSGRYLLQVPQWQGVVAEVRVNGQKSGVVYGQPPICDITDQITAGSNTVEFIVYGSQRNPLGPHLGNQDLGFCHPGSWNKAPVAPQPAGEDYFTMPYGLLAPFELLHETF
ncbi:MAG TPA: glycosyl hydrolase [Candidatus Hydrogenedentes bacterium]|nr:glycosyl hydrolase [Candidatus Hydrogenedentota bacterium]